MKAVFFLVRVAQSPCFRLTKPGQANSFPHGSGVCCMQAESVQQDGAFQGDLQLKLSSSPCPVKKTKNSPLASTPACTRMCNATPSENGENDFKQNSAGLLGAAGVQQRLLAGSFALLEKRV